jgi:hypothetical protein
MNAYAFDFKVARLHFKGTIESYRNAKRVEAPAPRPQGRSRPAPVLRLR